MQWLDVVPAVPVIGCRFTPDFEAAFDYLRRIAPLLNEDAKTGKTAAIAQPSPGVLNIEWTDGFECRLTPTEIILLFQYRVAPKREVAKLPMAECGKLESYSTLLHSMISRYNRIAKAVLSGHRLLHRVGVVANAWMAVESLPPGVKEYFEHQGALWRRSAVRVQSSIVIPLHQDERSIERCNYMLFYDADIEPKGEINLQLDWQYLFNEPNKVDSNQLANQIDPLVKKALAWFERFGAGEYRDETAGS